jgi:hypothetical protein
MRDVLQSQLFAGAHLPYFFGEFVATAVVDELAKGVQFLKIDAGIRLPYADEIASIEI